MTNPLIMSCKSQNDNFPKSEIICHVKSGRQISEKCQFLMFPIFLYSSFCIRSTYYVSRIGKVNGTCTQSEPCDYLTTLKVIKPEDTVIIKDKYFEANKHVTQFMSFAQILFDNNISFKGSDTIINGSKYLQKPLDFFLIAKNKVDWEFGGFTFTNFNIPIINFNAIHNSTIFNLTFANNYVNTNYAICLFSASIVNVTNVNFYENSVNYSSVLFLSTADINTTNLVFERNFGIHDNHDPLIRLLNSGVLINDSFIRDNSINDAPLIFTDYRSAAMINNCTIERNYHPEIILCEGNCNYSIQNSRIRGNRGIIFEMEDVGFIEISNTTFTNNFSPNSTLFYHPGGNLVMYGGSKFEGNHGRTFFDMRDGESKLLVHDCSFTLNSFDVSTFALGYNTLASFSQILQSSSSNGVGFISSFNGSMSIFASYSSNNIGPFLNMIKGEVLLTMCQFSRERLYEIVADGVDVWNIFSIFKANLPDIILSAKLPLIFWIFVFNFSIIILIMIINYKSVSRFFQILFFCNLCNCHCNCYCRKRRKDIKSAEIQKVHTD